MSIKTTFHKKKLFFKLLMSFLILAIISVVIIYTAFSQIYLAGITKELKQEYLKGQQRFTYEFDNLIKQIEQTYLYLNQNSDVSDFFYSSSQDTDIVSMNRATNYLRSVKSANPYLDSIILYNSRQSYPLIAGFSDIASKQFLDPDMDKPDSKSRFNMVFSHNTPTLNASSYRPLTRSLSLIFSGDPLKSGSLSTAIIFTLSRDMIEREFLGKSEGAMLIVDEQGEIIFSSGIDKELGAIAEESYFRTISNGRYAEGSFTPKVDNELKVVTYVKSSETGLYIIGIKPINNFSETLQDKRLAVIGIAIVVLLIYSLVGFLLTRSLYSPIKNITQIFSDSKYLRQKNEKMDELSIISSVFKETLSQVENLENKSKGESNRIQQSFLRGVLLTGKFSENNYDINENQIGEIKFSYLILACLKIDDYHLIDEERRYAFESTLCKSIPELMEKEFFCKAVSMYNGEIALFISYKNEVENNYGQLLNSLNNAKEAVSRTLQISLTIGIGGVCINLSECRNSYLKAIEMTKNRFILGKGRIIQQRLIEEFLSSNLHYPIEMENRMQNCIRLNKKELFIATLNEVNELLKNYYYAEAFFVFFQISVSCVKTINEVIMQEKGSIHLFFDELNQVLSRIETLDEASGWLARIFDEYQNMLEELQLIKGNKHYHMIEKIQKFIHENYADYNISVESIAEMTGYTPYYFSKIFREITGYNANDYIRKIRIDKAKELLRDTTNKINEVPEKVGFVNLSHFGKVFKKDVGLTPSAYREYAMQDINT